MATYIELVDMVREWSNRDAEVISNTQIGKFLDFAADNIYRDLRIAPLEYVSSWDISLNDTDGRRYNQLTVPPDAIEFIQLRKKDNNSLTGWSVYSAKPDIRSFNEDYIFKSENPYYSRERNQLYVYPDLRDSDQIELLYYRRLPDVDARYFIDTDSTGALVDSDAANIAQAKLYQPNLYTVMRRNADGTLTEIMGRLVPNWLRDENEKLLLFGALAEAFTYLGDPEMTATFGQRFASEMSALNDEDNMRKYKGGVVQTHYYSRLI